MMPTVAIRIKQDYHKWPGQQHVISRVGPDGGIQPRPSSRFSAGPLSGSLSVVHDVFSIPPPAAQRLKQGCRIRKASRFGLDTSDTGLLVGLFCG